VPLSLFVSCKRDNDNGTNPPPPPVPSDTSGTQIAVAVNTALSRFKRTTVTRNAGKVTAWDVVNESMADGTSGLRTSAKTPVS
ncbi:MAG: endo-1,4-beta-xylanase, partial [Flavisolibacter sp.]|nr:endo-1,4-beta-xylanase [Flavisolibacter sp.]